MDRDQERESERANVVSSGKQSEAERGIEGVSVSQSGREKMSH